MYICDTLKECYDHVMHLRMGFCVCKEYNKEFILLEFHSEAKN